MTSDTSSQRTWWTLTAAAAIVGILAAAVFLYIGTAVRMNAALRTDTIEGTIVGIERADLNEPCRPVFRFHPLESTELTITGTTGFNPCPWTPGDTVTVSYDPNNPDNAAIEPSADGIAATVFTALGLSIAAVTLLGTLGVSVALLIRRNRTGR